MVAITCIFLAGKVEENVKPIDDVIEAADFARLGEQRGDRITEDQAAMERMREMVLFYERILMCMLSFDLSVEHPQKYADNFVKLLTTAQTREHSELLQATLNILNDSLATNLILNYPPRLIAAAGVSLAVKLLAARSQPLQLKPRYLEIFQRFEKTGKIFEYSPADFVPLENELLTFYESHVEAAQATSV